MATAHAAVEGIACTSLVRHHTLELDDAPPLEVVVKLARPDWEDRENYERELRVYRELEIPMCMPVARYADRQDGRFVLVLEACRGRHPVHGMQADAVRVALDGLAALHRRYRDALPDWPELPLDRASAEARLERFARSRSDAKVLRQLDAPCAAVCDRVAARYHESLATLHASPCTLIHADLHVDNLLVDRGEALRVVALDWQGAAIGPALLDVAQVIGANAATDARDERAWLAHYAAAMGLTEGEAVDGYRAAMDYLLVNIVNGTAWFEAEEHMQPALDAEWERYRDAARAAESL